MGISCGFFLDYLSGMKKNYYLPLFIISLIFSCTSENDVAVQNLIEEYRLQAAPDKRVAVWDISFENDSLKGETDQIDALSDLLAELEKDGIQVTNAIETLPHQDLGENSKALVTISVANIRSQPKHSAELATQALMGTPLNVLKKEGGWYLVQTPDQYISWVDQAGIQLLSESELDTWYRSPKLVYTQSNGYAWQDTNFQSRMSDLVAGDILNYQNETKDFFEVSLPDGRTGWVSKSEMMPWENWISTQETSPEQLISTAKQMMGAPYLWGGTSVKGVDCSGFTKTIYYLNGQIIPRDASQQIHEGEEVDIDKNWENLQVGDLLFFGEKATEEKKERVVHVGMWIGNNEFIHSRGRVRISSFDPESPNYDEYEFNRYLRTKRIINTPSENILSVSTLIEN